MGIGGLTLVTRHSLENMIYIAGRYKDIIVRGENISMAQLELGSAEVPEFSTRRAQVIAAADTIAGEAPVLITKTRTSHVTVRQLKYMIRAQLVSVYVPRDVIPLDALGLRNYALTTSGKTNKRQLARMVKKYLESQDEEDFDAGSRAPALAKAATTIWARVLGAEASQLKLRLPYRNWLTVCSRYQLVIESGSHRSQRCSS